MTELAELYKMIISGKAYNRMLYHGRQTGMLYSVIVLPVVMRTPESSCLSLHLQACLRLAKDPVV
jgi:hypothetical protein